MVDGSTAFCTPPEPPGAGSVGGALLGGGLLLGGAEELDAAALDEVTTGVLEAAGPPAAARVVARVVAAALWWCFGFLLGLGPEFSGTTAAAGTPLWCRTVVTGLLTDELDVVVVGEVPVGVLESPGSR